MFGKIFSRNKKRWVINTDTITRNNIKVCIHSKYVKNLSATIKKDLTISVSMPYQMTYQSVIKFLDSKQKIIQKQLDKMHKIIENKKLSGWKIMFCGEYYSFVQKASVSKKKTEKDIIEIEDQIIKSTIDLTKSDNLLFWYKYIAKKNLIPRLDFRADKYNLKYNKVFIRSQKTKRWVCSSKNNIWLNYKLIAFPERISDYVIIHELCHTTHHNHSTRFRDLVSKLYPDYKLAKKWLKENWNIL